MEELDDAEQQSRAATRAGGSRSFGRAENFRSLKRSMMPDMRRCKDEI
jgi:hypothetical protein